jgi:hypothetical protein
MRYTEASSTVSTLVAVAWVNKYQGIIFHSGLQPHLASLS